MSSTQTSFIPFWGPTERRNGGEGFTGWTWFDGFELRRYDDGRVMVRRAGTAVEVLAVAGSGEGTPEADAHIVARFRPQS